MNRAIRLFSLAIGFVSVAMFALPMAAQERKGDINELGKQGYTVRAVTPIFAQLVMFSYPVGFKHAYENTTGNQYIQESVLDGETVEQWSQMITLTGAGGLAKNPNVTPQRMLEQVAGRFRNHCPETFAAKSLGPLKVSGHDAYAAMMGCGTVRQGAGHSEIALLIAIKGMSDVYTIQWAERASPVNQPPVLDGNKWSARFKLLSPIKLCPRLPGEPPPYQSCINQKN